MQVLLALRGGESLGPKSFSEAIHPARVLYVGLTLFSSIASLFFKYFPESGEITGYDGPRHAAPVECMSRGIIKCEGAIYEYED